MWLFGTVAACHDASNAGGKCARCDGARESACAVDAPPADDTCLASVAVHDGPTDLAISVDWSPRDERVLVGANGEVRLLEVVLDPPELRELAAYRDQPGRSFVTFSPDGEHALSGSKDVRLLAIERTTGAITAIAPPFAGHRGDVYAIAWAPDGAHALSVGEDGTARLLAVDAARGRLDEIASFHGALGKIYDVTFAPDGGFAAIAAEDGTLRVLAVDPQGASLRDVARGVEEGWVTAVAWSPVDDRLLAGTWLPCATVDHFAFRAPDELDAFGNLGRHESGVRVLSFGPRGDFAISAGHDDTLRLFAPSPNGSEVEYVATWAENAFGVHGVSLSPDGTYAIVAASRRDRVTLLEMSRCFSR